MKTRSQKLLLCTITEILLEIVSAICAFILPRLILSTYGSSYNGIISSVSQFISCIALLKSGIGSVTRASLYKPLEKKDSNAISSVVNTAEHFMRKISMIFLLAVSIFSFIYPLFVIEEFDYFFSFTLVLILSITTFAQYYFGLTYQMVLQADQRNYIVSIAQIVSIVVSTFVASLLICAGTSIHIVKLASSFVFVIQPLFFLFYCRKKYGINKNVPRNQAVISQRWNAFGHQLANFINLNTDIIIATIILGVKDVSVYAIYYMIANAVKKIIIAVSSGVQASFGNMMAKDELTLLVDRYNKFEIVVCFMSVSLFCITFVLFIPFIRLYTSNIVDVNYIRPSFAFLVCLSELLMCMKIPSETIVFAKGDFKKTQLWAYVEAAMNVIVSITLAVLLGLNGIIIGTIVAILVRIISYNYYVSKNIIHRSPFSIGKLILYCLLVSGATILIYFAFPLDFVTSYSSWFLVALIFFIGIFGLSTLFLVTLFRKKAVETLLYCINMLFGKLLHRRK